MMNKKLILASAAVVAMMCSCGDSKNENQVQAELDSLRNVVSQQTEMLDNAEDFIQLMNSSMDSVVMADGNMIFKTSEGGTNSREKMKQNLAAYKEILNNQRQKINNLRSQLANQKSAFATKMKEALDKMQEQLDAKDAEIAELQKELENKNISIQQLQSNVEELTSNVNNLTTDNQRKEETINQQISKLNEAYYIVATKKDLKEYGLLNGGGLFSKSKLNVDNVALSRFTKVDIRFDKTIQIPSGDAKILSQAPAGSYTLTKNSKNSSTLTINDPQKFWSVTRYLVIKY